MYKQLVLYDEENYNAVLRVQELEAQVQTLNEDLKNNQGSSQASNPASDVSHLADLPSPFALALVLFHFIFLQLYIIDHP